MSETEIAIEMGFSDGSHFSRYFKSMFGLRPSACHRTALPDLPAAAPDVLSHAGAHILIVTCASQTGAGRGLIGLPVRRRREYHPAMSFIPGEVYMIADISQKTNIFDEKSHYYYKPDGGAS